jgi:hypothetical protein
MLWLRRGGIPPLPEEKPMYIKKMMGAALAVLVLAAAAGSAGADGKAGHRPLRAAIEGPWQVTITPVDCDTGYEFSDFAFLSYLTFGSNGTLIETTSSLSFQPNQRSPGHGYWEDTGNRTYRGYFQAFVRFDSVDPMPPERPYERGVQSVDQSIQMQGRNHWTSDAVVRFSNVSGEMVPPSGCAKAAAERMP